MYKTILVGIDGSTCAEGAFAEALRLAKYCGARLEVVNVIDNSYLKYDVGYVDLTDLRNGLIEGGNELLAEAQARATALGVSCHARMIDEPVAMGDIATAINQAAHDCGADLLVIGTHGRHGMRRLLMGSVAEGLVRHSAMPVLLLRELPPGQHKADVPETSGAADTSDATPA